MINIRKNQVFYLRKKPVITLSDVSIHEGETGHFILNFWEQCDNADLNVLPVAFVPYTNDVQLCELKRDNIILGDEKDICFT